MSTVWIKHIGSCQHCLATPWSKCSSAACRKWAVVWFDTRPELQSSLSWMSYYMSSVQVVWPWCWQLSSNAFSYSLDYSICLDETRKAPPKQYVKKKAKEQAVIASDRHVTAVLVLHDFPLGPLTIRSQTCVTTCWHSTDHDNYVKTTSWSSLTINLIYIFSQNDVKAHVFDITRICVAVKKKRLVHVKIITKLS